MLEDCHRFYHFLCAETFRPKSVANACEILIFDDLQPAKRQDRAPSPLRVPRDTHSRDQGVGGNKSALSAPSRRAPSTPKGGGFLLKQNVYTRGKDSSLSAIFEAPVPFNHDSI